MLIVEEHAHAKINLFLDVLGKRQDGYHEVAMVMQSIELSDLVEITAAAGLSVETDNRQLGGGRENIAFRAAELMCEEAGRMPAIGITITKRIPLAAGLAGGSADAAAVLRGLNRFWKLDWPLNKLETLAAELGSDVPFCLRGGTALATGRGEIVQSLPDCPDTDIVLACPDIEVSTAWVYQNFSRALVAQPPDVGLTLEALAGGGIKNLGFSLNNVLELVTIKEYPLIEEIKTAMLRAGAQASLMSGSGPSVFALADGREQAVNIAKALANIRGLRTWVTRTRRPIWEA